MFKSFKEMPIWQSAMAIAERIYTYTDTDNLPKKEDYGFTSQIRRSAVSISANIAEAFGRNHTSDKINFYYIARGSLTETQSHLEYGKRIGYISDADVTGLDEALNELYNDLNKVLLSLKNSVSSASTST